MTSSTVMGLPSWKRAWGRRVKATQERSAGHLDRLGARARTAENGSSSDDTVSVSYVAELPTAGTPFRTNGFSVSNVPMAASRTSPPLEASGIHVLGSARSRPGH